MALGLRGLYFTLYCIVFNCTFCKSQRVGIKGNHYASFWGERQSSIFDAIVCLSHLLFSRVPSSLIQRSTGITSDVKCIFHGAICEILFMCANFASTPQLHLPLDAPFFCPECSLRFEAITLKFHGRASKENRSSVSAAFFREGSERSPVALSYSCETRKATCHRVGSWRESGPEGHRSTPPPVTYVHCNSIKRPAKLQIFFRLQRSHALISAKWCHVSCSSGLFLPRAGFPPPAKSAVR